MSASLEELRAFAAVLETGSFSAAAARLNISTNATSVRVQRLEEHLGVRLFARTTRRVTPTDEARAFYERVVRVLHDLEEAEEALRYATGDLRGTVRIAVPGALATADFLRRIQELFDAHPSLTVHVTVSNLPLDVVSAGLDFAVVAGPLPDSTLIGRRLGRAAWVLAATPTYLDKWGRPQNPYDLAAHRCLRLLATPPQHEWPLVDQRGTEITVPVGGGFEADDSRTLAEATYAGLGIGIRPAGECARAEAEGRLERVLPGISFQPIDIHAVLPPGRVRLPRVALCLEAVRAALVDLA